MDLNRVLQKENISDDKYVQLFCLFGINMKDVHDIPEMNFFEFLEIAYNKLTQQFQMDDLNHPFYDYLNTLMNQYLETYFLIKNSESSLSTPQNIDSLRPENKILKAYISQELKESAPGIYAIFAHSKIKQSQVRNIVKHLKKECITIDDVSNDFTLLFQEFVKNTYKVKDVPLNDDSVETACNFYFNGEYYEELLGLAQLGIENFKENPIYLYYAGIAHYFLDNDEEAQKYLSEFLTQVPDDIESIGYLAMLELNDILLTDQSTEKLEQLAKQMQYLCEKFSKEPNYNILYVGAIANYSLGNFAEAATLFEKVLEMDPDDDANFAYLAASYERSGQFQKALDLLLSREEEYKNDAEFQESIVRLNKKLKKEIL